MTLRTCGLVVALGAVGLAACGGGTTPSNTTDMSTNTTRDMATGTPVDMAMAPPKLTVPAGCTPTMAGQTSSTLYSTIVMSKCAGQTCHSNLTVPALKSAADVLALKNKQSSTPSMPYVTPGNIDNSYLLYKLTGEQLKVPSGSGGRMPEGMVLTDSDICKFIQWVATGATN
jgi:hypothetical protein